MNLKEKDIDVLRKVSLIAGIFTILVALTMLFSIIQLKAIDPLDNPVLTEIKEQYDNDPGNTVKAEQVRALDLMARKAYFASRRQIETGSYLLLAGAIVFFFSQYVLSENKKAVPVIPGELPDETDVRKKGMKHMLVSVSIITATAIIASFFLRSGLPDLDRKRPAGKKEKTGRPALVKGSYEPDAVNFPFFRGQDSRGIAGGRNYPLHWNGEDGTNIKWKLQIPKDGKSSPVIWGDKLFVTGAENTDCEVYCIDKKSGEILWSASASGIPGEPSVVPEMDYDAGMAVSTAAVNASSVCAIFANGNLICLDHDGNTKWAKNLETPENVYGYSWIIREHE